MKYLYPKPKSTCKFERLWTTAVFQGANRTSLFEVPGLHRKGPTCQWSFRIVTVVKNICDGMKDLLVLHHLQGSSKDDFGLARTGIVCHSRQSCLPQGLYSSNGRWTLFEMEKDRRDRIIQHWDMLLWDLNCIKMVQRMRSEKAFDVVTWTHTAPASARCMLVSLHQNAADLRTMYDNLEAFVHYCIRESRTGAKEKELARPPPEIYDRHSGQLLWDHALFPSSSTGHWGNET